MRVLHMAHMAPPVHNAGAETHTHTLLRALADAGHHVDVLLSRPLTGGDYIHDGVAVHGWRSKGDPMRFLPEVDVITCHLENTPRATFLGKLWRKPVVHVCHNDMGGIREWLKHPAVTLAVYNTDWMARELAPVHGGRSVVVHPYPDAADYACPPGDRVTLVNLWPDKGGEVFAELARRLPNVAFLGVIGAYGDPQVTPDLPNVDITAHTADLRGDVLSRTRLLLMPSSYESFGRVAAEAMCAGIPVIAHPTPGLLENLSDAGTFVDREDVDGWAAAITRLLRPRAWKAASTRAAARAAEQQAQRAGELAAWVDAMESIAARNRRLVAAL